MTTLLVCAGVWLLGSAFGYGWSRGTLQETAKNDLYGASPSLWPVWPVYLLGRGLGQRWMAHKLAPERMRQKLLQEQQTSTPHLGGVIFPTSQKAYTWPSTSVISDRGVP